MRDKNNAMRDVNRLFDTLLMFQKVKNPESTYPNPDDYEDYAQIWAESRVLRGRNLYAARASNVKTDVEFIIRYRTDIDETMRIIVNGGTVNEKKYQIEGIIPLDNTRHYLTVKAYEIKHDWI